MIMIATAIRTLATITRWPVPSSFSQGFLIPLFAISLPYQLRLTLLKLWYFHYYDSVSHKEKLGNQLTEQVHPKV